MHFFERKLSGVDIGKETFEKVSKVPLFLFNFCQNKDRLRGLKLPEAWAKFLFQ